MFKSLLKLNRDLAKSGDNEARPYYASTVVIDKERGKILLGKRKCDGMWTMPAGAANIGEHPKQAAIREAFEEANLQLKLRDLKELPSLVCGNGKVCHVFLVYVDSKKLRVHPGNDPDKEVASWGWYSLQEPLPGKIDKNRLTSINNAKMKVYGLRKGLFPGEDKICKGCHSCLFLKEEYESGICTGCEEYVEKSILENPDAGIDLNTAEQSQDEMGAAGNQWVEIIASLMSGAQYGETPRELMLPNHLRLFISMVDDGLYSSIVKKEDPTQGDMGEVQTQLMKMTPESMVQALKAKGYLPRDKAEVVHTETAKDFAGLYSALKEYEGELHIHLHKSKTTDLAELALALQLESML